jgi:TonB-dependent starch-binding outer membrane protein SusC
MQCLSKARQRRTGLRAAVASIAIALALPLTVAVATAQTGTVAGTVTDRNAHTPVPAAQVQIIGTTRGTLTGNDGHFRLAAVPSGPVQLRVTRIGFAAETRTVTVPTGDQATADFTLAATQITLDQVVVTGTQQAERERETGNLVSTIAVDSVNKAAIGTFSDLLTAKAAGVEVAQSTGEIGTGARIRIRGSNSSSLPNDPLLVIDGVYVDNNPKSFADGFAIGGQAPSRFDDLNPDDIANVEILKGPAASALYGTAGANGVILVTTKKGVSGKAQWTAHADYGSVKNFATYPGNYGQVGSVTGAPAGTTTIRCGLVRASLGVCTPTGPLLSFNPLESPFSPYVSGNRTLFGASVSGGTDNTKYFVSGDYNNTHGVFPNNFQSQNNARANVQSAPISAFDFGVNAGYLQSRLQLPQNDNNQNSPVASGYLGFPTNGPTHGFSFLTPATAQQIITPQNVERVTGSANANFRPVGWLTFTGVAGMDFTNRLDQAFIPPGLTPAQIFGKNANGLAISDPFDIWVYTTQLNGTAQYDLGAIHATSTVGTQYSNSVTRGTLASGLTLVPGTSSVGGATNQFTAGEIGNRQIVTIGYYGQQQFGWRDKMFLTAALRADNSSAFGADLGYSYYPSVSASWVIGEEPWFPKGAVLSSLRLRSAFGFSGERPLFQQAQTFFTANSYHDVVGGGEALGVSLQGIGNPHLKPERTHELEGGFDAGFFHDRINLQVTGYAKTTADALTLVNLAPSLGGVTQSNLGLASASTAFLNLGKVTNRGIEVLINSVLIDGRNTRLDLTINGSLNKNKLITLGPGIPAIPLGQASVSGQFIQQLADGFPLAGYFQQQYTYSDLNHDGIIEPNEVKLAANATYLGPSSPEQQLSFSPALTIFRYFRVATLIDSRNVVRAYNSTLSFKCDVRGFSNCQYDYRGATLAQQAQVVANFLGSDAGFVENASFVKWRELSLTANAPDRWASTMRVRSLSFTLAARNLTTWTKYRGADPEILTNGADNFTGGEFFTQPLVRYWTGRFNITF